MRHSFACIAIFTGVVCFAGVAGAQTTYVWQDTTNAWTTPAAWNPAGPADWNDNQRATDARVSFGSQAAILKQPDVINNVLVRGISIDNSGAAWNITSSFGALNIGADGLTVTGSAGPGVKSTTLSPPVNLTTAQTWTIGEDMEVFATNTFSDSGDFTKAGLVPCSSPATARTPARSPPRPERSCSRAIAPRRRAP